jgi:cation diffusion facilitator family transporter
METTDSRQIDKALNFEQKRKISIYSIVINTLLSVIKIIGGKLSGSAALMADGIHSLSDLAASMSVFVGITISNKKSKTFPFGLYKVENLVALVSAFAIFIAGYEIAKDVFFGESLIIKNLPIALGVLALTALITYLYSRWEKKMAIELNSPSLLADAEHIKVDFYTALVVLVGVLGQYFGYPIIEKIAVAVVVYFIFHSGFDILKEAIKVLLDASIDNDTIEKVKSIVSKEPLVNNIQLITGRNSGSYTFLQLDLDVNTDSLKEAHILSHSIEDKIKKEMPFVEKVIIHFE